MGPIGCRVLMMSSPVGLGCEPLAPGAAAIPVLPLTEVSGREQEAQGASADPPRFPPKSGRSGRFGRTLRPRSVGPTGADRADGPSEAAQRVGGSHPFGWRLRGTRVVSGALLISIGRERRISRFGSPRRHAPGRPVARSSGFQVRFARPVRPSSGNIGPDRGQWGQWDALATSCVRGEAGRRRRSGVRLGLGAEAGLGRVRGGRGDFRSPRVPSGPGGPPPQD